MIITTASIKVSENKIEDFIKVTIEDYKKKEISKW